MDFDYDSLVVLAAVIRTGSFDAAAKSLNVTQSAVSQRIKQLEERVGAILVQRGRPCVATEDGMLLCQHHEQIELLRHELGQQLSLSGGGRRTAGIKIRIAVNSDSLATWFPSVVKRAADDLGLWLEVIPDDQDFTEERLRSGDALAVVTTSDTSVAGCTAIPIGEMDYLAIASPEFVANYFSEGVSLKTISAAPAICFDRKDSLPHQWITRAIGEDVRVTHHDIPSYEGHLLCARQGIGWAMMPAVTVEPLVEAGELVEIRPDVRVTLKLFWQTRSQASTTLRELSNVVAEVAADWLRPSQSNPMSG
ncbi:MAG: LysR family transcriptional regulator ArgP [Silicimonas sp.]|nr:LysR family transcriptional regulator ArgP [Silicimonas sp.]